MSLSEGLLKIGQLARKSRLPVSTVRHYINEGLLGDPRKTSRNMAYYDQSALEKIALIQELKNEQFLPLKVIKTLLEAYDELTVHELSTVLEVRNRLGDRYHDLLPDIASVPAAVVRQLSLSDAEVALLETTGLISPRGEGDDKRYDELDYRILKAMAEVRNSGFSDDMATLDDVGFHVVALKKLARKEASLFATRLGEERSAEQIVELIRKGIPAVNEVICALHTKFLLDELKLLTGSEAGEP